MSHDAASPLINMDSVMHSKPNSSLVGLSSCLLALLLSACGSGSMPGASSTALPSLNATALATSAQTDTAAPSVASLNPVAVGVGAKNFMLTVHGSDFLPSASVQLDGERLASHYVDAFTLTATVPASAMDRVRTAAVSVSQQAGSQQTSNSNTAGLIIDASNPAPSLTNLSPWSVAVGSAGFTLSVSGSDFVPASVIEWNGTALVTTFVSASQLTAAVPAASLVNDGGTTPAITVVNPAPGGGGSNTLFFSIVSANPPPALTAIQPASAAAGSPAFTLTVTGSTFVAGSVVKWNGAALTTTYVSASRLTALVPASDVVTAGTTPAITVSNPPPGAATTTTLFFTITGANPVPSVSTLSPSSAAAGSTAFTITVNGSSFVPAAAVTWNGTALSTSYVSASQLTATVPASDLLTAGTANVGVNNPTPGGGSSKTLAFTIVSVNPVPTITSLSPTSVAAGSTAFTMTVTGSKFVAASSVKWNGAGLTTTFVSATQLTALVPASDLLNGGAQAVTVVNPTPGGGTSNSASFTVVAANPLPALTSLEPSSVAAGSSPFTLIVTGSAFVPASVVDWNGAALATTYVSATQLTALVPALDLGSAGAATVTVTTPAPGGGTSNASTFTINSVNPVPTLSSLSPTSVTAGSAAFSLSVTGTGFVPASLVEWNGVGLATTYVSATQLTALVPAAVLLSAATPSVSVSTPAPGGGTSGLAIFTINAASGSSASVRQSAQYNAYPGAVSTAWSVTLPNVQAGSTLYVVGVWPNYYSSYPTMQVSDGLNSYTLLDRYDDTTLFNLGMQGTESIGHWYAANVPAGTYTINMAPSALAWEDFVGVVAFEVTGVSSNPLAGHTVNLQANVAPGTNNLSASVNSSSASGLMLAVAFDEIDATAPTVPLPGTGLSNAGQLWDFFGVGNPSGRAGFQTVTGSGLHSAYFSAQEGGAQYPNYLNAAAIFH